MRAFALLSLWLLLSSFTPGQQVVALNPQVRPANASAGLPAVDDDFTAGGYPVAGGICGEYGHRVPCGNHYAVTRSGAVGTCVMTGGMVSLPFAANTMRNCNGTGQLIEEARTNDALWARDMTNAAWTKVGMGTALNATGADGTANSATTLTATGTASSCTASCTILQTITLGSSADTYSVYLMRVTGSGAVNITINNLVGTTACTLVTTAWTRCSVTATLANPVFGLQMATLNDVIVADFSQLEPGSFATSPIATTTVAVVRNTDTVVPAGTLGTAFAAGAGTLNVFSGIVPNVFPVYLAARNGASDTFLRLASATTVTARNTSATSAAATLGSGSYTTTSSKSAIGFDTTSESLVANNGTVVNIAAAFGSSGGAQLGGSGNVTQYIMGSVLRVSFWSSRVPDTTLKALSQ